jgi:hypothetical protein
MTVRTRLPNRRGSTNFELEVGGLRYTCTFSRFPDNSIAELFLNNCKSNSTADVNARDAAIALSFAVQYGAIQRQFAWRYLATRKGAPLARSVLRSILSQR